MSWASQLLASQCRSEIGVAIADDRQRTLGQLQIQSLDLPDRQTFRRSSSCMFNVTRAVRYIASSMI
ncbi:hypothetical protein WS46_10550 [Burkholderia sp. RF4-BP95]|nr:hypothetical protein WS45_16910 [Burkholderia sp. RF2-non_BP3]KUY84478.1 hypothetical protein WS46_10550 [Burkholderia sp. RF4-BP95]